MLLCLAPLLSWAQEDTPEEPPVSGTPFKDAVAEIRDDTPLTEAEETELEQRLKPAAPSQELAPDDLGTQLYERRETVTDVLVLGPISRVGAQWQRLNDRLDKALGLRVGFAYTALYQTALSDVEVAAPDPAPSLSDLMQLLEWPEDPDLRNIINALDKSRQRKQRPRGSGGDLDFVGVWRPSWTQGRNPGHLGFNLEWRHRYSSNAAADVADQVGSQWGTTVGFNEQDMTLTQIWWQQNLLKDRLILRIGKVDQSDFFNTGRFASANLFFLNAAFSDNPALAFPGNGFGFAAQYTPTDYLYFRLGWGDANGRRTETSFSRIDDIEEWFQAFEVGYTPDFKRYGRGNYRLTYWATDRRTGSDVPAGNGVALSIDQEFGERWVPFLRYGYSDGGAVDTRNLLAVGACVLDPFGREGDVLGVGVAWGEPYRSSPDRFPLWARALDAAADVRDQNDKRDQYTAEVFYRIQMSRLAQLTPGFQLVIDPTNRPEEDTIGIFSLRFRFTF